MAMTMEPALDVLHRALYGDEGARSFLDRTSSIYVLDATDLSKPHTYGCWNFIHQAMNEVERAEGQLRNSQSNHQQQQLVAHVQLLATMALRVARRSNDLDKRLVATCIQNAAKYHGSANDAQKLIDINVEIRDIVMGRLAALALDPSFHRQQEHPNNPDIPHVNMRLQIPNLSAFSDVVVLETFCAVLAANAVSNGPMAVRHFVSEWIIPSSKHLPPFCLTCITRHLASEARSRLAPAGTQEALQQLSNVVMSSVLGPVLVQAIKEESASANNPQETSSSSKRHEFNSRIGAMSLRAMNEWCAATDLSLPQIKHICRKVGINVVDVLNDSMYSDSRVVLDALAELIESVLPTSNFDGDSDDKSTPMSPLVSEQRMNQVRFIMQVDEASFRSNVSPQQLLSIESKEMAVILEEFVSAVGLQRYRFVDRQSKGDHEVCRNLTRIATAVCKACKSKDPEINVSLGPGLLDLLLKAASHPIVDISGIALEFLTTLVTPETGIAHQLLPILQGRAITPHQFNGSIPSLIVPQTAETVGMADFSEFEVFRATVLTDCLEACYKSEKTSYMSSCTAAIEEFCGNSGPQVSFHLEAVLFCIGAVSEEAMADFDASTSSQLQKCIAALASKPQSLMANPLTLSQGCKFIQKYEKWFCSSQANGGLDVATDLALSIFSLCGTEFPNQPAAVEMKMEGNVSPCSEAAKALQVLLCQSPEHFVSNQAIAALGAGWEASYAAANRSNILTIDDRRSICQGISYVLASLPENQRVKSLLALAMPALDCLETMLQHASVKMPSSQNTSSTKELDPILDRVSSEIVMVTCMARSYTDAFGSKASPTKIGINRSDMNPPIVEPALLLVKRAWPVVEKVATGFHFNEAISESLSFFLTSCLPHQCNDDLSLVMIKELGQIATSIIDNRPSGHEEWNFGPTIDFLQAFVLAHGEAIDQHALAALEGESGGAVATHPSAERIREVGLILENVLLSTVLGVRTLLGSAWMSAQRQGNGESAFESKSQPPDTRGGETSSNVALPPTLSLLVDCAENCPIFLLHLPAAPGQDRNEDLLLRRAIESAVSSMNDSDPLVAECAMKFMGASLVLTQSTLDPVRRMAEELLSRVRQVALNSLVVGACGRFAVSTLEAAVELLWRLLQTYSASVEAVCRPSLARALSTEQFLLGNFARGVVLEFLVLGCSERVPLGTLKGFVVDLWELHQVDSSEALEGSDSVARFCKKYSA